MGHGAWDRNLHGADTTPAPGPAGAANALGANDGAEAVDSSEDEADDDGDCSENPDASSGAADEEAPQSSSNAESIDDPGPPAPARRSSPARFWCNWGRRSAPRAATAFVRKGPSPVDMKLLEERLKASSAYVDVPDVLIMAAIVRHEGVRVPENLRQA